MTPQVSDTQITAELHRHEFRPIGELQIVTGFVYGDTKGRFRDGEHIRSSAVERIEGDLVFTENSVYRIIN